MHALTEDKRYLNCIIAGKNKHNTRTFKELAHLYGVFKAIDYPKSVELSVQVPPPFQKLLFLPYVKDISEKIEWGCKQLGVRMT